MTRNRPWYQGVMDVALRPTLEELGFRQKSPRSYVCEHAPDRTWIFEIELSKYRQPFREWTGIVVPEIEDVIQRCVPNANLYETGLRQPSRFSTSTADLVKISRGWDSPTWKKNEKPWDIFLGRIRPPAVEKAIPLLHGSFWDSAHAYRVLIRTRSARDWAMRGYETDDRPPLERKWDETAEAVGRELDKLWRTHAIDWLRKCDDSHFLAHWYDTQVYSSPYLGPVNKAVTAATAWRFADNPARAAEILARLIAETEERAVWHETPATVSTHLKKVVAGTRKLAKELGVKLD